MCSCSRTENDPLVKYLKVSYEKPQNVLKKPLPPTNSVLHLSRTSKTWSLVEKFILSLPRRSNIKLEFKQKKIR